jgi:alpha-ketoglutarate-dependent taurine dioxygenase
MNHHALSPHIGVEITDCDARQLLQPSGAAECLELLETHGVLVYRGIHLEDSELLAFSRQLGTVVVPSVADSGDLPEVAWITMDPAKSKLAGLRKGNFLWHIDGAHDEAPQKATLLTAWVVDPAGGDTEFANTYAAYEALTVAERDEIDGLSVVHRFSRPMEISYPDAPQKLREGWNRVPPRVHPLVWQRRNGRRSLLVGTTAAEVVGMDPGDGRALLDRLETWATQPQFTYRHRWQVGDLVVWDNTGMLHRALSFEPTSPRTLHRTTLQGDEPVAA